MPGKVKVKVLAGRHLPVMDRSNDTTDAFVEVKLGGTTCKTDVCRKSLNPQWNSEWFKFEMDDLELQDEPLQIRLMDYDTYSANDAIGKVYIDLNPLLTNPSKTKEPSGRAMSGWIPVYDTMHGIRGEVNLMVKVELFSDLNKFRQSSCGVKFFFTQAIPDGHVAIQLHGFVEELVVNDDPEYQWIDKIRTPRASNEARQLLFLKLAGEVQRRVGLKALELGGNAVIGYRVCFDLEGELGIVVRGIGTAATLAKTAVEPTAAENAKECPAAGSLHPPSPKTFPDLDSCLSLSSMGSSQNRAHPILDSSHHWPAAAACDCACDAFANRLQASPPNANVALSVVRLLHDSTSSPEGCTCPQTRTPTENEPVASPTRSTRVELSEPARDKEKGGAELSPTSPTSEGFLEMAPSSPSQFEIQRRRRGSKKREKYSTSSLLKRVSRVSSVEKKDALAGASAGEKIRAELLGFFRRRRRFLSGDTESSTEKEQGKAGAQAQARAGLFRKTRFERHFLFFRRERPRALTCAFNNQRRRSSSLRRSSSESFSIERVSLESQSLPSAKSGLDIDFDWSHLQIPVLEGAASFSPLLGSDLGAECEFPASEFQSRSAFDPETLIPQTQMSELGARPSSSTILAAVDELGYPRGEKPVTLYISSLDALLVRPPSTSSTVRAVLSECKTVDNLACLGVQDDEHAHHEMPAACLATRELPLHSEMRDASGASLSLSHATATATSALTNSIESESDTNDLRRCRDAVSSSGNVAPAEGGAAAADSALPKNTPENASAAADIDKAASTSTATTNEASRTPELTATEASSGEQQTRKGKNADAKTSGDEPAAGVRKLVHVENKKTAPPSSVHQASSSSGRASSTSSSSIHIRNGSTGASATAGPAGQHVRGGAVAHFSKASGSVQVNMLPPPSASGGANRRSSDSELSTPPTGAMNSSIEAIISHNKNISFAKRLASGTDHFDLLEYPFVTIGQLPPRFVQYIGGAVSARSVKLLERTSNLEEPETRDSWWNEIRLEIRSHARSLCCNVILGYEEQTTICDDVCILSATGTAALVNSSALHEMAEKVLEASTRQADKDKALGHNEVACNGLKGGPPINSKATHGSAEDPDCSCSMCHIPYSEAYLPFPVKMVRCQICKREKVPDLLLATIGFPANLPICGKTSLIQAHVFRAKKDSKGESGAKEVSDSVPFLEYELHRRLINKLKMKGMNAIFCLQVQICLGETLMIGVATGTAVCLAALPPPSVPRITGGNLKTDTQKVVQFQRVVQDTYDRNREFYRITTGPFGYTQISAANCHQENSEDDGVEEVSNVDLATGNKDAYVLEVDDAEDIDIISELVDPSPPTACEMNNLDTVVGYEDFRVVSQQVFAQIWRCHVPNMTLRHLAGHFDRLLRAIGFKLRAMRPCVINKLHFRVELPEPDEIQISIVGTALGLTNKNRAVMQEGTSAQSFVLNSKKSMEDTEMIFQLECCDTELKKQQGDVVANPKPNPILVTVRTSITDTAELMTVQDSTPTAAAVASPTIPIPGTGTEAGGGGHSFGHGHSTGSSASTSAARTPTQIVSFLPAKPATASSPHPHTAPPISYLPQISRSLLVPSLARTIAKPLLSTKGKYFIEVTTLSCIPGYRVEKYLGNLNCFFIRESTSIKEVGGPSGFVHNFVVEVLAIIRAHVAALGGNALVSYFMTELSILHNPHKNQGQCLINVGGDVVNILPAAGVEEECQTDDS